MKITMKKEWFGGLILLIILTLILVFKDKSPDLKVQKVDEISYEIEAYINGAVFSPGVYTLDQGARLNTLLEKAGGFLDSAEQKQVNLARVIEDGEMIWIYEISDEETLYIGVDFFNYETKANIMTLEGVGVITADKIINYRIENGPFNHFEDLLNIDGIGEEKLKNIMAQLNQ